jgi:hypothetical protein
MNLHETALGGEWRGEPVCALQLCLWHPWSWAPSVCLGAQRCCLGHSWMPTLNSWDSAEIAAALRVDEGPHE